MPSHFVLLSPLAISDRSSRHKLCCSILHIANKCLEEDVPVFKYSIQDIVDELEVSCTDDACSHCCPAIISNLAAWLCLQEMRKTCKLANHKVLVSRLLFILTRCSRLVLSGNGMSPGNMASSGIQTFSMTVSDSITCLREQSSLAFLVDCQTCPLNLHVKACQSWLY